MRAMVLLHDTYAELGLIIYIYTYIYSTFDKAQSHSFVFWAVTLHATENYSIYTNEYVWSDQNSRYGPRGSNVQGHVSI